MAAGSPVRAVVAGSTGYIGMQCVSLLARHPHVELVGVLGRSHAGERHCDVVPGSDVTLRIEDTLDTDSADVVVAALPHAVAAGHAQRWLSGGATVIDLSADFRLRDPVAYGHWYGIEHPAPELCEEAVYGLVELQRDALRSADLVAVPGCYPTAALLACAPAVREGLVAGDVIIDAKSGVSGAGRSPQQSMMFAEVNESVHAYGVSGHRHKPEMTEQLSVLAGSHVQVTFVPHLVPMTRGILATAYLRPVAGVTHDTLRAAYQRFCTGNPFLRLVAAPPTTKSVVGSNTAALHVGWQDGAAVVTVAIDNLIKGAAGQGVQALNVRFGFDETAALAQTAQWP
jgi:N-acetyl-gamma-glutamyl-phosphate reductase